MVQEILTLTAAERFHLRRARDHLHRYKGCVCCWIKHMRPRFIHVKYPKIMFRESVEKDAAYLRCRRFVKSIAVFQCPHVDRFIVHNKIRWTYEDETRFREVLAAFGVLEEYEDEMNDEALFAESMRKRPQ